MLETTKENFGTLLNNNSRWQKTITAICPMCKNQYEVERTALRRGIHFDNRATYCSKKCRYDGIIISSGKNKYIETECINCKIIFSHPVTRLTKCCSIACRGISKGQTDRNGNYLSRVICECGSSKDIESKECQKCSTETFWKNMKEISISEYIKSNKLTHATRVKLQWNARAFLSYNNIEKCCKYCGFTDFIEIAHIKPVKSFRTTQKMSEINSLQNLIYLCPNHHTMLDKGIKLELFKDIIENGSTIS